MIKILIVLGTRPEIIRLSSIIKYLDLVSELTVVHTGQNFDKELNENFFSDLNIRPPDYYLDIGHDSKSSSDQISKIITKTDEVLDRINPDCLLILGDTNSALAAIPAKRKKIPIFHYEAGNRSFDQRVPEEVNRKIVDHISDINITYSEFARDNLLKEGIRADRVFKIGSPMKEVIESSEEKIKTSSILKTHELKEGKYFLVTFHREENVDLNNNLEKFLKILTAIKERFNLPIIVSTHPRTMKKIQPVFLKNSGISFLKPFNFSDFINLQINAACVLSDSGTITEETSILKFPALNIRESFERQEGMSIGNVFLTGFNEKLILDSILNIFEKKIDFSNLETDPDYDTNNISKKIYSIIVSYIDVIKREHYRIFD